MRGTVTFECIEFRAGPRDGERMVFEEGTAPPYILVPIRRLQPFIVSECSELPPPNDVMPVGKYEPELGPYEYDRIQICHEVLMHSKCRPAELVLATFAYKRLRPMMWKWCGER